MTTELKNEFQMLPLSYKDCVVTLTVFRGDHIDLAFDDTRWELPLGWRLSALEARALAAALVAAADGGQE